jgi:hypothetical protein
MAKKKYADRFVGITPREYGELEDRHKRVLEVFSKYEFEGFWMSVAETETSPCS